MAFSWGKSFCAMLSFLSLHASNRVFNLDSMGVDAGELSEKGSLQNMQRLKSKRSALDFLAHGPFSSNSAAILGWFALCELLACHLLFTATLKAHKAIKIRQA